MIVFIVDSIFSVKRHYWCNSLQSFQLFWKLILYKYTTLRCSKVCSTLFILIIVKWFVNNSYSRSHVDSHSDQTSNMVHVAFCKSFSSIKWVYPNNHIIFNKFIWELVKVPIGVSSWLLVYLFHFSQVMQIGYFVDIIVFPQHLLGYVLFIYLVWLNIWFLEWITNVIFIFLTYSVYKQQSLPIIVAFG